MNRLLAAGIAGIVLSSAFAQLDPAAIVLTVNGDSIKASDYFHRMEILPGVSRRIGSASLTYPPGFLTLEALITERLVFQLARQKGVLPTDKEVQDELASILKGNPDFLKDAALLGQSRGDVEHQIRFQLAQFKLTTFGVTITDAEVDKFYKDRPNLFTIPRRVKLSVIAVSDEASKSKVDAELAAGKTFADVAKLYSEDVSKESGGDFGTVVLDDLPKPVRDGLAATKIGQISAWVEMRAKRPEEKPDAVLFPQARFMLHDIIAESKTPLDDNVRKNLRRRLMIDRGSAKNDIAREMKELREKSKITFANKSFADLYKKYMEELGNVGGGSAGSG